MALSHKLKDDSKIVYPFGPQCKGYANTVLTVGKTDRNGNQTFTPISEELTQDVIDLLKERDETAFNELFEAVGKKGKSE